MALFVSSGQGNALVYAGDSALTRWFLENYGFEFKQKCAEFRRNGDSGTFASSLGQQRDQQQQKMKNLCPLPLLSYHIDDPRLLNTKVIKQMYSKMMSSEGLSRCYGVEDKMPKWWVGEKGTEEEKQADRDFWKSQIGCNPPHGVSAKEMNWPATLKKYLLRCYLFHLESLEAVREYYEYVPLEDHDAVLEGEQLADAPVRVEDEGVVEEERVGEEHVDGGAGDDEHGAAKDDGVEMVTFTPDYLIATFSCGQLSALPDKRKPVVLQYRACMRNGGLQDKVVIQYFVTKKYARSDGYTIVEIFYCFYSFDIQN